MSRESEWRKSLMSEQEEKETSIWENPYWNIFLLAMAWALTLSTSTLLTTIGPLSAVSVGATNSLAAFSIGIFLMGAAVSSVPSGVIFRRYGRLHGFTLGCTCQILGSLFGLLAIHLGNLGILFMACFFVGLGQGLGQFYRFAAMEVSPPRLKSRSVTYVLSGGIIAAFLGPTLATYSKTLLPGSYFGSYMLIGVMGILNEIVVCLVNFKPAVVEGNASTTAQQETRDGDILSQHEYEDENGAALESGADLECTAPDDGSDDSDNVLRTRWEIVTQPMFIIACTVATLAHTLMVMVMSNASIAMVDDGYSVTQANLVLEMHFFAMFSPGFFTGALINRIGTFTVSFLGAVIFAGSAVFFATGDLFLNFMAGMVLLGIAWNFSFSAGTVMLTSCYKPQEAAEVQAINDFVLFSVAGAGGLGSGFIYARMGWHFLIYTVSAMMVVNLLLFGVMWRYSTDEELAEMQGEIEGQGEEEHGSSAQREEEDQYPLPGGQQRPGSSPVSRSISGERRKNSRLQSSSFSSTGSRHSRIASTEETTLRSLSVA